MFAYISLSFTIGFLQLHPLLKVSAHRDARDAFVPRSSSSAAAVKIPGVDIDEYTVDLEMSIAQVRARARVSQQRRFFAVFDVSPLHPFSSIQSMSFAPLPLV
jgi:hypothetical protein